MALVARAVFRSRHSILSQTGTTRPLLLLGAHSSLRNNVLSTRLPSAKRNFWWSSSAPAAPSVSVERPPVEAQPTTIPTRLVTEEATALDAGGSTVSASSSPAPTTTTSTLPSDLAPDTVIPSPPLNEFGLPIDGSHFGDLHALGLASHWTPPGWIQSILEAIHVGTGLPWWATIILVSLSVRMITFPVILKSQVNTARVARIKPQIEALTEEVKTATNQADRQRAILRANVLWKEHDCHPLKSLWGPLVQVPTALFFFFAIKKMCSLPVESLKTGGLAWFGDLTATDPFFILPVLSSAAVIAMLETSSADNPQTPTTGHTLNVFRVLSLVSLPFMAYLPTGLLLYFTTNGASLLIQTLALRVPSVRERFGLPPLAPTDKSILTPAQLKAINPSFKETAIAVKQWFFEKQAEAMRNAAAQKSLQQGQGRLNESVIVRKTATPTGTASAKNPSGPEKAVPTKGAKRRGIY